MDLSLRRSDKDTQNFWRRSLWCRPDRYCL